MHRQDLPFVFGFGIPLGDPLGSVVLEMPGATLHPDAREGSCDRRFDLQVAGEDVVRGEFHLFTERRRGRGQRRESERSEIEVGDDNAEILAAGDDAAQLRDTDVEEAAPGNRSNGD